MVRWVCVVFLAFAACSGTDPEPDSGTTVDLGTPVDLGPSADTGPVDTGPEADTGPADTGDVVDTGVDAGPVDTGSDAGPADSQPTDTGPGDAPSDTGPADGPIADTGGPDAQPGDTGPGDTGPADNGPADVGGMDIGPNDTGSIDTGVPPGPCVSGAEGCSCASTRLPAGTTFLQDNCQTGLLCIDWDNLSGQVGLLSAFQSCVRPCTVDADCGSGRSCQPSGFDAASGAENICVDRLAGHDEFCGFSRLSVSVAPDPNVFIETPNEQVGCAAGSECLVDLFGDIHVSEGVCARLCQSDLECVAPTPFCNTERFTTTSTVPGQQFIGICQSELFQQGQLCGTTDPVKLGLTSGCDTGPTALVDNQVCVGLGGLFDPGLGTCLATCNALSPCAAGSRCVPNFFANGDGVCSEDCTIFPESCSAAGGQANLGFGCFELDRLFNLAGDEVSLCMERLAPALTSTAVLDATTGQLSTLGDNCWATGGSNNFLRCPYPSFCEILDFQNGVGACLTGCSDLTAPLCPAITGVATSTCVDVFMDPTSGLCGN